MVSNVVATGRAMNGAEMFMRGRLGPVALTHRWPSICVVAGLAPAIHELAATSTASRG
jgi:hypothetical protein